MEQLGVFFPETKQFYILETGKMIVSNHIDIILKRLIQRDVIKMQMNPADSTKYEILSVKDSQSKNPEVITLYLNPQVKAYMSTQEPVPKMPAW